MSVSNNYKLIIPVDGQEPVETQMLFAALRHLHSPPERKSKAIRRMVEFVANKQLAYWKNEIDRLKAKRAASINAASTLRQRLSEIHEEIETFRERERTEWLSLESQERVKELNLLSDEVLSNLSHHEQVVANTSEAKLAEVQLMADAVRDELRTIERAFNDS